MLVHGASALAPVVLRESGGSASSDGRCSVIGGRQVVLGETSGCEHGAFCVAHAVLFDRPLGDRSWISALAVLARARWSLSGIEYVGSQRPNYACSRRAWVSRGLQGGCRFASAAHPAPPHARG